VLCINDWEDQGQRNARLLMQLLSGGRNPAVTVQQAVNRRDDLMPVK